MVVAWVFFRAETFGGALTVLSAMFVPASSLMPVETIKIVADPSFTIAALAALMIIVITLPNSIEITRKYRPVIDTAKELALNCARSGRWVWRPAAAWGVAICAAGTISLIQLYRLNDLTEFIYFNF